MFKLPLVLVLFLGIQPNAIIAAALQKKDNQIDNSALLIDKSVDDVIDTENETVHGNPEEGEYIEGDILLPNRTETLAQLYNNSVDAVNNATSNKPNPVAGEYLKRALRPKRTDELSLKYDKYDNTNTNPAEFDNTNAYPEEGEYIEGDLIIPPLSLRSARPHLTWPGGLIPYALNGTFTRRELRPLLYAFDQYIAKTCIRFYPRTTEVDYISIQKPDRGCASNVGRMGGKQTLNLGPECFRHGTIMHELMHVVGFLHEQNRYDRDEYVKIIYENIKPGHEPNYKKFSKEETNNLGLTYDYGSIMHYRVLSFSKNDEPTIVPLKRVPEGVVIGQRKAFSHLDVVKINQMYRCNQSVKKRYRKKRFDRDDEFFI